VVRLRPAPHTRTRILSYSMRIEPAKHFTNWQQDPQSNYLARVVFADKTNVLRIEVDLIAEMAVLNPFDFFLEPHAEQFPFVYTAEEQNDLAPYLKKTPATARFAEYLAAISRAPASTANFLVDLNGRLARDVRYLIRMEPGVQTPEETLLNASGSCRDSAWLLVQLLRNLGLAARFASGYLVQLAADVKSLDGPSGPSADFADLHAWCEVYLPGAGWIGLDPTSGLLAGEGHIPLACTPEPQSAAPVSGLVEPCEVTFEHSLRIDRIWEAPRVTKPYSEAQWTQIELLGHAIDTELKKLDVRLTMGGEPTFVSVDDPDAAEWNTAALGEQKRILAMDLYQRLRERHAPTGLQHLGQGKWYPGEQLPRWSLNSFWRRDGEPVWRSQVLLASESVNYSSTADDARRFLAAFAAKLGLLPDFVTAAYEDPFYYEWREARLPANVDSHDARLDDAAEGARLARLAEKGRDTVTGYVLPLARDTAGTHWQSGAWFLRRKRCYLAPGDSPMGMRLPLDSLPWAAPEDRPQLHAPDPNQPFAKLPAYAQIRARLGRSKNDLPDAKASRAPGAHESAYWIARNLVMACSTSSCRQPVDSRIISSSSRQSKPPPRSCRSRSSSRATSRRATRDSITSG
jgi:transglutaminase-like putative cysteine protease